MANATGRVATRLYIPAVLAEGSTAEIDAAQTHRLRHVLRLGPSAAIAVFNARDGEFLCRISELGRNRGALTVETRLRAPEPEADLWLLFAPIKRLRLDWLIEKGTELGVSVFVPVMSERTQPERLNRDRLVAHAIAAAEQSERLSVPEIREAERLSRVLDRWDAARLLIVCDETGGGEPIGEALRELKPAPVALLAGPEGGFTQSELDALADLPFVSRVGLGPRVLRAETAVLAALAAYQAIAGDGRRARSR